MMDFALCDNDIDTRASDIAITSTDTQAVAQAIKVSLKTFAGEWFLDTQIGVPYFTHVFGHKRSVRYLSRVILPAIENIVGAGRVSNFSVDISNARTAHISFNVALNHGQNLAIKESIGV